MANNTADRKRIAALEEALAMLIGNHNQPNALYEARRVLDDGRIT